MRPLLLISLSDIDELFLAAHTATMLNHQYPGIQIDLITWKHHEETAKQLASIREIHYLNGKKIKRILSSKIYNNAFALNVIKEDLQEVMHEKYDWTLNISKTKVSNHLIEIMNTIEKKGVLNGTNDRPDRWTTYSYSTINRKERLPLHPVDVFAHQAESIRLKAPQLLKVNSDFLQMATQNFTRIRQQFSTNDPIKLIGISMLTQNDERPLSIQEFKKTIHTIYQKNLGLPLLISTGTNAEKSVIDVLNQEFDQQIIAITCTENAITPILGHLDYFISDQNILLQTADSIGVQTISYHMKYFPKNAPTTENGHIVIISSDEQLSEALIHALETTLHKRSEVEAHHIKAKVFQNKRDEFGQYYPLVAGPIDVQSELKYYIERCYLTYLLEGSLNKELLKHIIENTEDHELNIFVSQIKDEITSCVKILLNCLRGLKSYKQSKESRKIFATSLNELIELADTDSILNYPVYYFKMTIEGLLDAFLDDKLKTIEESLYSLKADIQSLSKITEVFPDTLKEGLNLESKDKVI